MDRKIIYPGAIPLDTDLLGAEKNAYVGLGRLAEAVLGTAPVAAGFAVTPLLPAPGWGVVIAAGQFYSQQEADSAAYGSLGSDGTLLVKQGLFAGATFSTDSSGTPLAAPASGYTRCYLVQAQFSSSDGDAGVLPYYNSASPTMAWNGPDNSGSAQPTTRADAVNVQILRGSDSSSGALAPDPTPGWTGLWLLTVNGGDTAITAASISTYSGAPLIVNTLTQLAPAASPAFSGVPTAPTPVAGDSSGKLATTQFVQQNSARVATLATVSGSATLGAAQLGALVNAGSASAFVLTLPAAAGVPAGMGYKLVIGGSAACTLTPHSGEAISYGPTSASSLVLSPGDTLEIYGDGSSGWFAASSTLFNSSLPTGAVTHYFGSTAPLGWLARDGGSIGNAASGAAYANADALALFTLIWTGTTNSTDGGAFQLRDSSGSAVTRGSSALADFAAGRRLPLPDDRGLFDRGLNAGGTGTDAARVLGTTQEDAQRNITGHVPTITQDSTPVDGAFAVDSSESSNLQYGGTDDWKKHVSFDASRVVGADHTAAEVRPANRAYLPIIKL